MYKTKMCTFRDNCKFGDTCRFAHSEAELRSIQADSNHPEILAILQRGMNEMNEPMETQTEIDGAVKTEAETEVELES